MLSTVGEECTDRYNALLNGATGSMLEGGIRVPAMLRWPAGLGSGRQTSSMVHFTDWTPTLFALAGGEPAEARVRFDGQVLEPLLWREPSWESPTPSWQRNRFTPVVTGNEAVRDANLKLVRPETWETIVVRPSDLEIDRGLKCAPETILDTSRDPEPAQELPATPEPLHFDLAADPLERVNLAARRPRFDS